MSSHSTETPASHKSQLIFQDLKRRRFSGALIVTLVINLICILIFAVILDNIYQSHRQHFRDQQTYVSKAHQLQHAYKHQLQAWDALLLSSQDQTAFAKHLANFREQADLFQDICHSLSQAPLPQTLQNKFTDLLQQHKTINLKFDQVIQTLPSQNPTTNTLDEATQNLKQQFTEAINTTNTQLHNFSHHVESLIWDKVYRFGILFVLALLVLNIATLIISSMLSRRMYRHVEHHERRLQNVMQAAPIGVFLYDEHGQFCDANKRGIDLLEYYDKAQPWHQHIHPEDLPNFLDTWNQTLKNQDSIHYELRMQRSDGSIRWLAFNATPEIHLDELSGYIACIDDITSAKAVEELLRSNEERLRIMLHALTDGVIATDVYGRIQDINPSAELLCALKHGEAVGQNIDEVCHIINRSDQEIIKNPIYTALEEQDMVNVQNGWALLAQDDTRYEIEGSAAPIFNDQGDLVGAVLVMRDITDQLSLQHRLRHSEKMQSIGQLTGGIAHDFNNMLGAIMGAAQVLDTLTTNNNDKSKEYIQVIMRVSENAAELVRNLLTFSRKSAVEESDLLITDVVDQTIEIARHALKKNIDIQYSSADGLMYCRGDQAALQSCLLNLFINAQDAMPNGGTLNVHVDKKKLEAKDWRTDFPHINDQQYISISISDTGTGIATDIQERVFEPFFTTKERGKGTGLGLAAVYGTINSHAGCIKLFSEAGKGTRFTIYLPMIPIPAHHNSSAHMPIVANTNTHSVLIIDDDENLRPILASLVNSLGYQVFDTASGIDGVELYRTHQAEIKIILLDLVMPNLSGRETFDQIRRINPEAKIILISGYDRGADSEYLLEHGAIAYLRKPFSMHDLADLLDQHIDVQKD